MKFFLFFFLVILAVQLSVAPPVTHNKKDDAHSKENEIDDSEDRAGIMEYRRYLTEVLQVLESDPDFRAKLEKADQTDIQTGKIADQLEFVSHKVRTKLDEIKREELERLRHLATRENELMNGLDTDHLKIPEHLDHTNTRTFEIQDLKKLIAKISKDLAEEDRKRREQFKQYEMEKMYEEQQKLKSMNDGERKKYEEELKAEKEKHKKHEHVHHPGSKQQLEEVWEKQDHMESEDFNPTTFFYMHDVDGNGVWDQDEVKALFLKELDKLYAQGASQDELLKRTEEMERMREHVFNEADYNKDGLISYDEFLEQTKNPEFQQDKGWEGIDEQQIFTPEEFEEFEKHKQEEIQRMIAKGMPPPHPGNIPVHHESFPPQYGNVPVGQGVAPPHQQFQGQYQPHQQYPNHIEVNQIHGQVPPQQQYHPQMQPQQPLHGQVSDHQQYHPAQLPVQQQPHPGQAPVQQPHSGQVPVQQPHPGQVPVQQPHPGQVPVHHQQYPGQVQQQQQLYAGQVQGQQQLHHSEQAPVQQPHQGQGTMQHHDVQGQGFQQQNTASQIPQNPHSNVGTQQNVQGQAQQGTQQNVQSGRAPA